MKLFIIFLSLIFLSAKKMEICSKNHYCDGDTHCCNSNYCCESFYICIGSYCVYIAIVFILPGFFIIGLFLCIYHYVKIMKAKKEHVQLIKNLN